MSTSRSTLALVSAAAAISLLPACTGDDDHRSRGRATPRTPAATTPDAPTGWTPLGEDTQGSELPAGRYGLDVNGRADVPWAVVTAPAGLTSFLGWALVDERTGNGAVLSYWTVSEVDRDPCGGDVSDPMYAGRTVEDLVMALADQQLTRRTRPVPVSLDGHRGVYLEIEVPKDLDLTTCFQRQFFVWESDPEGARHMELPGTVDRLWIVDVDGEVVVLDVTVEPGVSKASADLARRVLETVEFVRWP